MRLWKIVLYVAAIVAFASCGTYTQAPFEDITKEKYEEMMTSLTNVDLTKIVELEDETNLSGELACAGGSCEIT